MIEKKTIGSWKEYFGELAGKLIEYRNKQKELIETLERIGIDPKEDEKGENKVKIPLSHMDPFTFVSLIFKFRIQSKILNFLKLLKAEFNLESDLPLDLKGMPSTNALKAWLFPYSHEIQDDHIDTSWNIFEKAYKKEEFEKYFNKILKSEYLSVGKGNLSHGLFRFFPDRYFPVDSKTRQYIQDEYNIDIEYNNYSEYLNNCKKIKEKIGNDFIKISHDAHLYSKGRKISETVVYIYFDDKNKKQIDLYERLTTKLSKDNIPYKENEKDIKDCHVAIIFQILYPEDTNNYETLVNKFKENNLKYLILSASNKINIPFNLANSEKTKEIFKKKDHLKSIYKNNYDTFDTEQEAIEKFDKFISNYKEEPEDSEIKILEIQMKNIGIFKDVNINFDKNITALIGFNGTGKSTVLKALLMCILGEKIHDELTIEKNNFLKSIVKRKKSTDYPVPENTASIKLKYKKEEKEFYPSIELNYKPEPEDVVENKYAGEHIFEPLIENEYQGILVIGFGQQRGYLKDNEHNGNRKKNNRRENERGDIIPLLLGKEENKLSKVEEWLLNEYSSKSSNKKVIELYNKVIQKIAGPEGESNSKFKILFYEDKVLDRKEILVERESGVIPISLSSQGYQFIMGLIGYIIRRMHEYYVGDDKFNEKPAIILIDEIDTYLHPEFQNRIIGVLREFFPNVQFIITTHSPLVVSSLRKEQVVEFNDKNGEIEITNPFFSPYGATANTIIESAMHVENRLEVVEGELEKYFEFIKNNQFEEAERIKKQLLEDGVSPSDSKFKKAELMIRSKKLRG